MLGGEEDDGEQQQQGPAVMEIGWPTDVRHVAHVTFDRFHGFRGVPEELVLEGPPPPSASTRVFGVSPESMHCSPDGVPTILLHLQRRLYDHGGLAAEGIFRITADAAQERRARDHLTTSGEVPLDVEDVHCLAGLIKAWFRELPGGLLDSLPPDEVARCLTDDDCARLCAASLPPSKAALLHWALSLMADVARHHEANKMGTRNLAVVFAPNMLTQAVDPLTALKHTVQVMNFLNMLIERALKQQQPEDDHGSNSSPSSSLSAAPTTN
ncbi:hypothetical protein HU200_065654 [Digitaria exilis]|uniref:Rho GTPase activating protein n=1 Tax=Digitaria exilis TaxID=1010633 RepID=A0A835A9D2_9POAL|nr:hypothetical protein HU200_065654 [Digitaria exilis]CAB3479547.1 unnamed protein product [Digitaria exilis]